jgi:jumonji domain-containing protein 2
MDVAPETFKKYKQAGLLENAITDVLRRAGAVGKAVRGSSLVMQVEQALGVGSGTLRSHGNQIQTMSRTLSRRVK